ncbi:hypothetical protein GCM10010124_41360 [Pilimelia terevasa]|uniref:PAS domain-containing protein n=1 Tax=Pilimelia terevasa TaxID=53372 RepID=A0A8J3BV38_9ACTN|nr:hypothetical protein GCM10010124_41360 [Pilimelia terevasa]
MTGVSGAGRSALLAAPVYSPVDSAGGRTFRGWILMGLRGQDFISQTLRSTAQDLLGVTLQANLLALIMDSISEAVIVVDRSGLLVHHNSAAAPITGPGGDRAWLGSQSVYRLDGSLFATEDLPCVMNDRLSCYAAAGAREGAGCRCSITGSKRTGSVVADRMVTSA